MSVVKIREIVLPVLQTEGVKILEQEIAEINGSKVFFPAELCDEQISSINAKIDNIKNENIVWIKFADLADVWSKNLPTDFKIDRLKQEMNRYL